LNKPAGGILGNLAGPVENAASVPGIDGPMAWATPMQPPSKPSVPFYGPGDVLLPPPEPAPPEPPRDFRAWLRGVLSDQNVRYYAGPHLYDALRKLHALTQLLPGSGTVQSTQDASRAGEEAQAGHYGKAAAHMGMGTVNAALDWLPPAKLALLGSIMARTFPWDRLPTALDMEAAGRSAKQIWREAGLERDAVGNWLFGIPDKGYRIRTRAGEPTIWPPLTHAPLYEHHDHPGMREAYPQLADIQSFLSVGSLERPRGRSTPNWLVVRAPDLGEARSVGIHELQHLIGDLENLPPGGAPSDFRRLGFSPQEAFDRYWKLIGEVVSRNAQHRLRMPERLRKLRPPSATEDVPRDQQINLYDDRWR
jgi:hypothetical protein